MNGRRSEEGGQGRREEKGRKRGGGEWKGKWNLAPTVISNFEMTVGARFEKSAPMNYVGAHRSAAPCSHVLVMYERSYERRTGTTIRARLRH